MTAEITGGGEDTAATVVSRRAPEGKHCFPPAPILSGPALGFFKAFQDKELEKPQGFIHNSPPSLGGARGWSAGEQEPVART